MLYLSHRCGVFLQQRNGPPDELERAISVLGTEVLELFERTRRLRRLPDG